MKRIALRLGSWCVFAAVAAVGCPAEEHDVAIIVDDLDGFACVDRGELVACDAAPGGCLVVDVVSVPGLATCREDGLIEACRTEGCPVVKRATVSLSGECACGASVGAQSETMRQVVATALEGKGPLITDAPDGIVIVRMTLTAGSCDAIDELDAAFEPTQLRGCAFSCPAVLDLAEDEVHLGLTGTPSLCNAEAICRCALPGEVGVCDGASDFDRSLRCP